MAMTRVVQRVGANGLQLPKELVEGWGAKEGQEVIIELARSSIRIVPAELDAVEIADRASAYAFDRVGDATAVGEPERAGEGWRVPILLSYRPKQLGVLTYSLQGELLPEESDSAQTMRERSREG
jgi:antitoxin component of MazEF toxin-antitoxin module